MSYSQFVSTYGPHTMEKGLPAPFRSKMKKELLRQQEATKLSIGELRANAHRDWCNNKFSHPRNAK